MHFIKNFFFIKKYKIQKSRKKIADYNAILSKLLTVYFLIIIGLIPVVKYLMAIFEGKDITYGQAAVFVVQTITTTGYGDLLPFYSYHMKFLSIFLMLSGVFALFVIAGTRMAALIENRISPKAPTFTNQHGHIIFTIYNEIVDRTVKLLEYNNVPYVVASKEQSAALELIERGITCVFANPAHDQGLNNLGVQNARLVVVANGDTENINIILGVSTISNAPVLAVMENENRAQLAYTAGAKYVVTLEETLGLQLVDWIYADASPTEFLKLIDVDVSTQVLKQLKPSIIHIGAHSEFKGKSIGEAKIRSLTGTTVVAVWHPDGTITTPIAGTIIDESTLIVLGPHDNVDKFASFVGGPGPGEHVVLIGAGRVGQQAGRRLNQSGISPCVIDIAERHLSFNGSLIVGDATMSHILSKARIKEADTLIVTINDDSLNIFIVLASKQINPDLNIVARVVNADAIERLHQAGANHILSESILGAQLLQVAMVDTGTLPKYSNYVIREITWEGGPVKIRELAETHKKNRGIIKIICVVKGEEIVEPTAEFILQKDDRFVVLGSPQSIECLKTDYVEEEIL